MVQYEWDVETVAAEDTMEWERGEVLDHNHVGSYAEALEWARGTFSPRDAEYSIVLVRDDDESRTWAYVTNGSLGTHFLDSAGYDCTVIPKRFHEEVARGS